LIFFHSFPTIRNLINHEGSIVLIFILKARIEILVNVVPLLVMAVTDLKLHQLTEIWRIQRHTNNKNAMPKISFLDSLEVA
jgi:hypothetical protein